MTTRSPNTIRNSTIESNKRSRFEKSDFFYAFFTFLYIVLVFTLSITG
jgi:hypothetical protein